jgi:Bacterial PH domain
VTEEVRTWYGRALTVAIGVICAGMCISLGLTGSWEDAALVAPWAALIALACWAAFWRPMVAVSPGGVRIVNVTRTIDIPWPAIQDVETKWALTLVTAYGRFTAWSAPAPGARSALRSLVVDARRDVPRTPPPDRPRHRPEQVVAPGELADTPSGSAAALVRQRWEELRAAGHLDDPRLERDRPPVRWHVGTLLIAVALVAIGLGVTAI